MNQQRSALASEAIAIRRAGRCVWGKLSAGVALVFFLLTTGAAADFPNARKPGTDAELREWLENMLWHHHFTTEEMEAVTGLAPGEIETALRRFGITPETKPTRSGERLLVLPYPGGRHPRIGFLEGAIDPQRETKLSVFLPWDPASYIVVDVPEAIWSNLGLMYLAHTHLPTIWSKQGVELPPLEWQRLSNRDLKFERTLPNGVRFGTQARAGPNTLFLTMWLYNGTDQALTNLRVQNCVMLKGAAGFNAQTNSNKLFRAPFAACRSERGDRWIIQAAEPVHRAWGNAPVPCLHSDPKFPDAEPRQMQRVRSLISFYAGREIEQEFDRLEALWSDETAWPQQGER